MRVGCDAERWVMGWMRAMGQAALALAWLAPVTTTDLSASPALAQSGWEDCAYVPANADAPQTVAHCAMVTESGQLHLAKGQLDNIAFDTDNLAVVQVGKLFFYVDEDGKAAQAASVEGHAVEFHEGLAPSPRLVGGHSKIGYVDQKLNLVIPARYDGGLDFSGGRAQVCRGCTISRDGDYAELQGGQWGCIDHTGKEVIPVTQPLDGLDCGTGQ
jgi:hypothetical protein